jgi:tetratricopeptide (TPR) repeat protein
MEFSSTPGYTSAMPEKSFQEIPRAWREQYEKGKTAFERNNLDYAIEILSQILEQEPGFFECRQALRAAQFKKAGIGSASLFRKLIGSTNPKLVQAQLAVRNNPRQALNLAEDILNHDPNNMAAHKVVADAALGLDLLRTAVLSLEIVFKQSSKDRDISMKLARALMRVGQGRRAEGILAELNRAYPKDNEIAQALKDMSASRTMSEGGYDGLADGKGSYRDILKDEKEAVTLEQEKREHRPEDVAERLLADYEARLPNEPENTRLLRQIAELQAQKKNFDKALEYYQKVAGTESADPTLERTIADIQVRRLDHALSLMDPQAPDYAEQCAKLKSDKQTFLLEDARRRVEKYPSDLQLRFELGQLYLDAGRVSEAILEFQKAQANPHKRIPAMGYLGQCFARRGMHDLAARTFLNAIKEKTVFDDEKKELVYALGGAYEKMGKTEEAIEQYKLIYEIDIGYRDVAAKVDAYYAGQ